MKAIEDKQSIRTKYLIDLSKYEINGKLGHGLYGNVVKIKNKMTDVEYAAKIIYDTTTEDDKKMINREIGILIRLQHPTLIRFIGYSLKDFLGQDNVVIVTEYARNGSLYNVLKENRKGNTNEMYDNTTRQKILIGIAYAMMYLHRNHVIYRDLKPANVVLDEYYHPHLTDFGTSKFNRPGHTLEQTNINEKSFYMAPEVMNENNYNKELKIMKYDGKADVYSFAILMFEVVTENLPYSQLINVNDTEFAKQIIENKIRPKFTDPVKKPIKELIEQCWSEDPKERPTFEEIFNKLAFNLEDSVYDVFEEDDKYKYFLDDVNVEEIFDYVYEIKENANSNPKIDRLIKDNELLKLENNRIKKEVDNQDKIINDLITENKKIIEELEQTKIMIQQAKQEITLNKRETKQTKQEITPNEKETKQTKDEITPNEKETKQTKDERDEDKNEINQIKNIENTPQKLIATPAKKHSNRVQYKEPHFTQYILVGGLNNKYQLGKKSNQINNNDARIINPPKDLRINPHSIQSYSVYGLHSVLITKEGVIKGIGSNDYGQINSNLQNRPFNEYTEFEIKEDSGLIPVSALCYGWGTLYLCNIIGKEEKQLILCDCHLKEGLPYFIDINSHQPVALFGGYVNTAAIDTEGNVIFISGSAISSYSASAEVNSLPDGEKALSVACCDEKIFVLSENGRVFFSNVKEYSSKLNFNVVKELADLKITHISGTCNHCFAVSDDGQVFGFGSNNSGQLGVGKEISQNESFQKILTLSKYNIRAAYAGGFHSLFQTNEGEILSCGSNDCGQLLLDDDSLNNVHEPIETVIKSGATFCIAGYYLSAVFVGINPPPNTPNIMINQFK